MIKKIIEKHLVLVISFALFTFLLPTVVFANPWVQEEGRVQTALTVGYSFYDNYYDDAGKEISLNDDYHQYEALYYYNWGIGKNQDLSLIVGYVRAQADTVITGVSKKIIQGITDSRLRYRKQIHSGHTAIALVGGISIPGTYDEAYLNSPGDATVDFEAGVAFGEYYHARTMYWSADVLYRIKIGTPEDEYEIDFEAGRVFDKLLIRGIVKYTDQTSGRDLSSTSFGGGIIPFDEVSEERFRIGGGIDYRTGDDNSIGITYLTTQDGSNTQIDDSIYLTYTIQNK